MPLPEKLKQQLEERKKTLLEKSQISKKDAGVKIDSGEWLLLFLSTGFIDMFFILLVIVGHVPFVGQVIYAIVNPTLNLLITMIFWLYLQYRGIANYWWLAFGGGIANLIPIVNWAGWTVAVFILYLLVKAEKTPLTSPSTGGVFKKIIKKAAKIAVTAAAKVPVK